jgi:glycosyltransferase involved in cell wall biosynthesis
MTESRPIARVELLHNYGERAQPSMMIYADQLGRALEGEGFAVDHVRPRNLLPEMVRRPWLMGKLDSLAGRYALYPWIARSLRADVFHVTDHGQGHLVASLDPARTVVTCHDVILLLVAAGRLRGPRPPLAPYLLSHSTRVMCRARGIVAVSERTRRDLAELTGVDCTRVRVVPNGLNPAARPRPEAREELRVRLGSRRRKIVLHVGSTLFYKNVEGCLRVTQRLRASGRDVLLVRAGARLSPDQLALARRLGLGEALYEFGPVSDDMLVKLYNSAEVLLFPSLYEGFGWPPIEAMACGTPVVCSRGGALPEVVGDAALTADAEDDAALAAHVEAVLDRPELADLLRMRGRARAAQFTWSRTASRIGQIYREVMES